MNQKRIGFWPFPEGWQLKLFKHGRGRYTITAINVERLAGGVIYYGKSLPHARGVFNFLAKQDLSVIKACVRTSGLKD